MTIRVCIVEKHAHPPFF